MMRCAILILAVAVAGTVSSETASADQVILSFPELTGDYETGWQPPDTAPVIRETTFTIPPDVLSIEQMRLVLSGNWAEGLIICDDGFGGADSTYFTPGLSMFLTAPTIPGDFFHATILPPNGVFDQWSATFESCCPPGSVDPNLLLGAEIHAELFCDLILIGICWVEIDSYGTLTDVRVEITGTVPTESHTWGAVKSLYR